MKTWKLEIKIIGLGGEKIVEHTVKAKTEKVAERRGWEIIGNQTGEIIKVSLVG